MLLTFKTQDASHNVSGTWYKNGDGWVKYNNSELTLSSLPAAFEDIYTTIVLVSSNTYPTFLDAVFGLKEPQTLFGSLFK